jgi:hypothetical protein
MRLLSLAAMAAAVVVALSAPSASAQQAPINVADFQDEFGTGNGWSYLWNANGALGNPANYVPLTGAGDQFTGPSGPLLIGRNTTVDPVAYPALPPFPPTFPSTLVRPGLGSAEAAGGIERAAIIAYTFTAADLAAAGVPTGQPGIGYITAYDFAVSTLASPDGMSARIYTKNDPTPIIEFSDDTIPPFPFGAGFRFETTLDPRPIPLGTFGVGDTLDIALGGNNLTGTDEMRFDFTLGMTPVPEPTAVALLAAGALLLRRRRR